MNKLIVIRGTSSLGNVTRAYLNLDEHQALTQVLQQFTYVSSDVIEFDHELQVDTPEPFLRFRAVDSMPVSTQAATPWRDTFRRLIS